MQSAACEYGLKFVALGGIWLDEICTPGKETLVDVPGGSVPFATFGALLFASQNPKSVGLIVKAGHDFPPDLEHTFRDWNVDLHILRESDKPSSRGRILYGQNASERRYQRLTPPLPSTTADLASTHLISSACFHFFDTPETVQRQIDEITALRAKRGIESQPLYVWEPQAKTCSPGTFEHHKRVVEQVDIFSPNHAELASFFAESPTKVVTFDKETIEQQARAFMPESSSHPLCILVRSAEHGCFVISRSPAGKQQSAWLPAYHQPGSEGVVDPTGAGNAFLGGASMGYLQHKDFTMAAAYGSVAASFAVEVVGLPEIKNCDARVRLESWVALPRRSSR